MNCQSVSTDKFAFAGDLQRESGWSSIRDALVDLAFSRDWDSQEKKLEVQCTGPSHKGKECCMRARLL